MILQFLLLVFFHFAIFIVGYSVRRYIAGTNSTFLFDFVASSVLGLLVSIPSVYILAVIFSASTMPIFLSVFIYTCISLLIALSKNKQKKFITIKKIEAFVTFFNLQKKLFSFDSLIVMLSFLVSWYIMSKTFVEGAGGELLVAKNVVFDFGHLLSIVRSISWGANIPYMSPFVSGTWHLYHFIFHFWAAIFEKLGVPIVLAVNIPSAIGFFLFLLTMYVLCKEYIGSKHVGALAVLFIIFHSSLVFIPFIQQKGFSFFSLFRNPDYLFAGPFDGSVYSIFFTLNVFVNQRQLGLSLAVFFILYVLFRDRLKNPQFPNKKIMFMGILMGFFVLWHIVLSFGIFVTLFLLLLLKKKWKKALLFFLAFVVTGTFFIYPWVQSIIAAVTAIITQPKNTVVMSSGSNNNVFQLFEYILKNFGILTPFFIIGIIKNGKWLLYFLPMFLLILIFFLIQTVTGAIDQKFLNIFLLLFKIFSAMGAIYLWGIKKFGKIIVILLFPLFIASGIIDFFVIKNDFLFPIPQTEDNELISWINKYTSKDSIFLSYQDIFDPVALAGRKTYLGFFQQPQFFLAEQNKNRALSVQRVYEAKNTDSLGQEVSGINIRYIIIPLKKDNFDYFINFSVFREKYPIVFEDDEFIIFDVRKNQ